MAPLGPRPIEIGPGPDDRKISPCFAAVAGEIVTGAEVRTHRGQNDDLHMRLMQGMVKGAVQIVGHLHVLRVRFSGRFKVTRATAGRGSS
jgi:hypothetical protein